MSTLQGQGARCRASKRRSRKHGRLCRLTWSASVMSYVFLMLFTLSRYDSTSVWKMLSINSGVASVRRFLCENRSKYAAYSVLTKRDDDAIRENIHEWHDISKRMTTFLERTDITGRIWARYSRSGRLRLCTFRSGAFGAVFTPPLIARCWSELSENWR